jgi:predicted permease
MSFWSRVGNVFRTDRLDRELDEEFNSHIAEAIEQGRDPGEARRALSIRQREESRDVKLITWLDSLRADIIFGWRQLMKRKVTSAAAIASLALGIGACASTFRLIDALLLRPLPIAHPERLYALFRRGADSDGKLRINDSYEHPLFQQMREAVKGQAELIAVSGAARTDLTFGTDQETEKAYNQYVSGRMFRTFGLQPALGRLLNEDDDVTPGEHPYAVLSYDYWTSRFARDPRVIGRTFRMAGHLFEIIGVAPERFTGTEPGTVTGIFLPTMMNEGVRHVDWSWVRVFAMLKPGVAVEPLRDRLRVTYRAFNDERAKAFPNMPRSFIDRFFHQTLLLEPAAAGVSGMQRDYARSLTALGLLAALVLLIACSNVANLLTAQAAARSREMALRVSIGAGRRRLVQLVLVESLILAFLAAATGGAFAWWSAPFIVSKINPPDNPVRLFLPADWRMWGFGLALSLTVALLFGVVPALRASAVRPASALKGGEDPHGRRRIMHALVAVQSGFCVLVLFVAGLLVATFDRLSNQPTGFSSERLVTLDTVAQHPVSMALWDQVKVHLRSLPGVETVAMAGWPLLDGNGWNGVISVNGAPPTDALAYFLSVSPGWLGAMKIPLLDGRDFRAGEAPAATAIVNEAFARRYFSGENPVGKFFETGPERTRFEVIGLVKDVRYRNMREPITATAYLQFARQDFNQATFIVRTTGVNPLALAPALRSEVSRARPEFRVSNIRTQVEINQAQTVRERLLAMLALFFASVALLLAGVGLYGVLDYSVLQRRREIGIRMAIGARPAGVAQLVTVEVFTMVLVGAIGGLALGMASTRYIEPLFYQVRPTDLGVLAIPSMTILLVAALAAVPAVIRAVRIDPVEMLRSE